MAAGNHQTPAETVRKVGSLEKNLADEYPAHEVTISKPFYMGIYEVTQAQHEAHSSFVADVLPFCRPEASVMDASRGQMRFLEVL